MNTLPIAVSLALAQVTAGSSMPPVETGAAAAVHATGTSFRDCPDCPDMVTMPTGTFVMGTSLAEEERHGFPAHGRGKSLPQHKVTFRVPFAMGKFPVTVAQFRTFVNETGYAPAEACFTNIYNGAFSIYEETRGYTWRAPGYPQDDRHPVVCVSSEDAEAYADWLSRKTGHAYAVPNEAQYEYATRAGTTTSFFWGDARDAKACEYSNQPDLDQGRHHGNVPMGDEYRFQCSDGYAFTSPVGTYKANPWGLYDMQGNIWEWTSDCWNESYAGAPNDGSTWTQGDCDARPSRGGSWGNAAFSAMAGIRTPRAAGFVGHSWGFRVVRNDMKPAK